MQLAAVTATRPSKREISCFCVTKSSSAALHAMPAFVSIFQVTAKGLNLLVILSHPTPHPQQTPHSGLPRILLPHALLHRKQVEYIYLFLSLTQKLLRESSIIYCLLYWKSLDLFSFSYFVMSVS